MVCAFSFFSKIIWLSIALLINGRIALFGSPFTENTTPGAPATLATACGSTPESLRTTNDGAANDNAVFVIADSIELTDFCNGNNLSINEIPYGDFCFFSQRSCAIG